MDDYKPLEWTTSFKNIHFVSANGVRFNLNEHPFYIVSFSFWYAITVKSPHGHSNIWEDLDVS